MKLNRNERARLEEIRKWARTELRKDLDTQLAVKDLPGLGKLLQTAKDLGVDLTIGPNSCLWLIKLIERELGVLPTAKTMLDATRRMLRKPSDVMADHVAILRELKADPSAIRIAETALTLQREAEEPVKNVLTD